jgi:hypothetical protein
MEFYYYEIREDNHVLGKTKPFHIKDMHSSWIDEELKYIMSKSKNIKKTKIILLKYNIESD